MSADANGLHQVKGGDDRLDDIIAQRMRDLNISESSGALKIPEHCVVNSRAHMRKCGRADAAHDAPRISTVAAFLSAASRAYLAGTRPIRRASSTGRSSARCPHRPTSRRCARRNRRAPREIAERNRRPGARARARDHLPSCFRWTRCPSMTRGGCSFSPASRRTCHSSPGSIRRHSNNSSLESHDRRACRPRNPIPARRV